MAMSVKNSKKSKIRVNSNINTQDIKSTIPLYVDEHEIEQILKLLKKKIRYSTQKDIVLILGNTGSGKTIFTQFITDRDNNLIAAEDQDKLIIKDETEDVLTRSTKVIFPNLLVDTKTNTAFYDFPGFNKVQSVAEDIAKTYFMKRVIESADKVKLVFTISYSPDTKTVDKQDLISLIKQVVSFIDNVNKFKNSIALVITKVDNERKENKELLTDKVFKEKVAEFLRNVRSHYLKGLKAEELSKYNRKAVEFIDILLTKNDHDYSNIGIFKRPSNLIKLQKDKVLQKNKELLKKIVQKNIITTKHNTDDFKYTLPPNSTIYLRRLRNKIEKNIALDVENIAQEVQKYYQSQEETLYDIDYLHDTFVLGYKTWSNTKEALSLKGLTKSKKLVNIITQSINDSHISNFSSNISNIEDHIGYLNFIEAMKNRTIALKSLQSVKGLVDTVEYLSHSEKWYNFLIKLYNVLSKYDVQIWDDKYTLIADEFMSLIEGNEYESRITIEDIKIFVSKVSNENFEKEYKAIENVRLNPSKLYLLNNIIYSTLLYTLDTSCNDDKLTIQGNYIKLQDIDQLAKESNCMKPKSIKMFALNKVFIDSDFDKTGEQVHLSIIAPTWDIINTRKIILDGVSAKSVSLKRARDGQDSRKPRARDGEHGNPGKPGGTSGHLLGIGKTFINGENLSISVNGGRGGPGQDGGNGHRGIDGTAPEDLCGIGCYGNWNPCNVRYAYSGKCYLYGKNCTDGGNGGHGGAGGVGGHAQKIILIPLENDPKFKVNNTDGEKGADGIAGTGDVAGNSGKNIKMDMTWYINWASILTPHFEYYNIVHYDNLKCHPGKNGTSGMNTIGIEEPVVVDMEAPTNMIHEYKNYVRENIYNNVRGNFLKDFIEQLENHQVTEDLYDTQGFVKEMQYLENHFYKSNNKSQFLPLYQSLLRRINHYANNPIFRTDVIKKDEKLQDYRNVLNYLSAATQSKINRLKNHNAGILVLNLSEYLKSVKDEFNQFNDLNNIASIHKFNKNYQKSIEDKSSEAQMFIENQITPEIDSILKEIDDGIDELINDTISRQNQAMKEKEDLVNSQQELQNKFVFKSLLGVTKTISQFLGFAGPVGVAAGTAMSVGANIGETLFLNDKDNPLYEKVAELPAAVTNSISSIADKLKEKKELFKEQINDLEKELENMEGDDRDEIQQILSDAKNIVNPETSGELSSDLESVNKISEIRVDMADLLKKKSDLIKERKAESSKNDKQFQTLENMQKVLKMSQVTLDCYKKIRSDQDKIEQISSAIRKKEADLKELEKYENDIYEAIIPMCDNIRKIAEETQKSANGKSHTALDISKWKVQSNLKDFKRKITKMTEGYKVQEDFIHFVEKLNEGITTMIIIYDRIQDNQDRADFAKYIANLNSNGVKEIGDETLKAEVDQLMLIIQRNIILERYETVIKAFGQYIYPFADRYLSGYNLSTDHNPENIDILVENATTLIHDLNKKLSEIQNVYTQEDEDIFPHAIYSKPINKPFFTWNYEEYKKEITQLLRGEKIFIKSDVKNGHRDNAIKFKDIGIRFKLADESLQRNFDAKISNFRIIMTHFGNSYYKCDEKIHVITSRSVTFKHILGTDNVHGNNDDTKNGNNVHNKVYNNVPLLSPYAMWSMKLRYIGDDYDTDFESLELYLDQPMNIELEGAGQHVDDESTVCLSGNLDKYYNLDETLSGTLQRKKMKLYRERRSLKELLIDTENNSFTTSKASSSIKSALLNNIVNLLGSSLVAFEYLNPLNKISQWFKKQDKNIYKEDSIMVSNNVIETMELLNILPISTECSSITKTLISDDPPIADDVIFNSSLFCTNSNLLLLDLLIRRKSGVKYDQANLAVNKILDSEYAQSLAYKNQLFKISK